MQIPWRAVCQLTNMCQIMGAGILRKGLVDTSHWSDSLHTHPALAIAKKRANKGKGLGQLNDYSCGQCHLAPAVSFKTHGVERIMISVIWLPLSLSKHMALNAL